MLQKAPQSLYPIGIGILGGQTQAHMSQVGITGGVSLIMHLPLVGLLGFVHSDKVKLPLTWHTLSLICVAVEYT